MILANAYALPQGLGGGLARIRSVYPSLAPAEQKVADYVLEGMHRVIYQSVTQLADHSGVGESTVIRFCQAVGFRGYQELKLVLARDMGEAAGNVHESLKPEDDLGTIAQKVSYNNIQTIQDTLKVLEMEQLDRAIQAIVRARRVEFYGVGSSGFTACDAKYKFMRIGISCDALTDAHLQAMSASLLTESDVAVGISHTGSTKDVVDSVQRAKNAGATVICITDYARSPITQAADISLLTASRETPLGSGAIRSKIAQLHVLDLLFTGASMQLRERALESTERTAEAVLDKLY